MKIRLLKYSYRFAEQVLNSKLHLKSEIDVLADCITSYDKKKIDEMIHYYKSKGSKIIGLNEL